MLRRQDMQFGCPYQTVLMAFLMHMNGQTSQQITQQNLNVGTYKSVNSAFTSSYPTSIAYNENKHYEFSVKNQYLQDLPQVYIYYFNVNHGDDPNEVLTGFLHLKMTEAFNGLQIINSDFLKPVDMPVGFDDQNDVTLRSPFIYSVYVRVP